MTEITNESFRGQVARLTGVIGEHQATINPPALLPRPFRYHSSTPNIFYFLLKELVEFKKNKRPFLGDIEYVRFVGCNWSFYPGGTSAISTSIDAIRAGMELRRSKRCIAMSSTSKTIGGTSTAAASLIFQWQPEIPNRQRHLCGGRKFTYGQARASR